LNPRRNIIVMQWTVIAVLVLGGGVAVFMATHKADDYKNQLDEQQGNLSSLREQLRQRRNPTPTPGTPLPEATSNGPATTPTPTQTMTPKR
jgi:hypothetical protein